MKLAPSKGKLTVGVVENENRRLSTEFQSDALRVNCVGIASDHLPDLSAPCEGYLVHISVS